MLDGIEMYIINRLRPAGIIKSIRLSSESVVIRTVDDEVLVYRRTDDENDGMKNTKRIEPVRIKY